MASTPLSFLSTVAPQHSFRGAIVHLDTQTVELKDAAECIPNPSTIPRNHPWIGAFAYNRGAVNIIVDDDPVSPTVVQLLLP